MLSLPAMPQDGFPNQERMDEGEGFTLLAGMYVMLFSSRPICVFHFSTTAVLPIVVRWCCQGWFFVDDENETKSGGLDSLLPDRRRCHPLRKHNTMDGMSFGQCSKDFVYEETGDSDLERSFHQTII